MRCLTCDYDLRGLSENRCPECGREFDPADATTFKECQPAPDRPFYVGAFMTIGVVVLVVGGFFIISGNGYDFSIPAVAGWIFAVGLLAGFVRAHTVDMLVSAGVLALFFCAIFGPNCLPNEWGTLLMILVIADTLLFLGFLAGPRLRAFVRPR